MKKKSKRLLSLFLSLFMLIMLTTGCTGKGNSGNTATGDSDKYIIKFAHDHSATSPYQTAALKFKELVEEKSNGKMEVQVYPAQQLGNEREMIEGMQMGTIEMVWTPTAKFAGFDPKITLVDLPYIFPNEDIMWEALEGDIGKEMMGGLESQGIKGLAFSAEGYKVFTANKKITSPDDFKGMKIRTMEAPVIMAMYKQWGANPVPLAFNELYNSLQQKVVDGQENPIISIHDMKFYEVQKYLSVADHAYLTYFLSCSSNWFNNLPNDLQNIVLESVKEMNEYHKVIMEEANNQYIENIKKYGTEIYIVDEEARKEFKEKSMPIYEQFYDTIGKDLIDKAIKFGNDRS